MAASLVSKTRPGARLILTPKNPHAHQQTQSGFRTTSPAPTSPLTTAASKLATPFLARTPQSSTLAPLRAQPQQNNYGAQPGCGLILSADEIDPLKTTFQAFLETTSPENREKLYKELPLWVFRVLNQKRSEKGQALPPNADEKLLTKHITTIAPEALILLNMDQQSLINFFVKNKIIPENLNKITKS